MGLYEILFSYTGHATFDIYVFGMHCKEIDEGKAKPFMHATTKIGFSYQSCANWIHEHIPTFLLANPTRVARRHCTSKGKKLAVRSRIPLSRAIRYSSGSDSNSKDVDSMGEKSDEEETYIKEKEHIRESITSDEEKRDRKDTESKNEKPESNEENNPGIALRLNKDLNHGDQRLRVNEERDLNEPQNVEEGRSWTLILHKDEAYKENIEDKDRIEETGNGELEDGFHRFLDENEVPEDVDHIIESMPSESSADKKSYLLQESRNRPLTACPEEEEGKSCLEPVTACPEQEEGK
ncbi:hypothetical protein RHMOL_Rhmol05G0040500 [Rhododendron molle]|uniref:Uncharacterized protein n=1 Tax=Rhododendron molle TaxID=49168 RepID=A0ACC0NKH1_RHOML|nr:hypothetical protein RHMOL_Rhmol05G0040500 [Rhododendron molle]